MYPETLYAINEGIYLGLLLLIEAVTLIAALASVLFIILCLVGAACGCFAGPRQPAPQELKPKLVEQLPNCPNHAIANRARFTT